MNNLETLQARIETAAAAISEAVERRRQTLLAFGLGEVTEAAMEAAEAEVTAANRRLEAAKAVRSEAQRSEDKAAAAKRLADVRKANKRIRALCAERDSLVRDAFAAIESLGNGLDRQRAIADELNTLRQSNGQKRCDLHSLTWILLALRSRLDRYAATLPPWPMTVPGDLLAKALAEWSYDALCLEEHVQ